MNPELLTIHPAYTMQSTFFSPAKRSAQRNRVSVRGSHCKKPLKWAPEPTLLRSSRMRRSMIEISLAALLVVGVCSGSSSDSGPPEPPNPCPAAVEKQCNDAVSSGAIPESERGNCLAVSLADCSTAYYFRNYPPAAVKSCNSTI